MMILKSIKRNILNIPGWQTERKIIVIESDDWGTVRVSSPEAYRHFLQKSYPVNECPYNSYDMLESNKDMELLFETLWPIKDSHGNPAIITMNNNVANPDFDRIKNDNFQNYYFEPFTETYNNYPNHDRVVKLYKDGIENKMLMPQFHGKEHVNVARWMEALQQNDKSAHSAFEHRMFSVHAERNPKVVNEFMDALNADSAKELNSKAEIVIDGLNLFKNIWGFSSDSFIAPCYIWDTTLAPILAKNGVKYLQGLVMQFEPVVEQGYKYKRKYHYQGQRNKLGQYYLIRNAFFEPSSNPDFDWVSDCLNRIEVAFRWGKPAIICSHRLNFMGGLNQENRSKNLNLLESLLKEIIKRWPMVEFKSTNQLGDMINQDL